MATPTYPGAVKAFGADLENLVNIVFAAHVNDLRAEVVAVETEIGLGLRKSITWANRPAFDRPTSANFTWGDLSLRLSNIEAGLVSSAVDVHPQYFLTTGGSLTGPINMGNNMISNLGNGTVSQDAVNLGQLNDVASVAYAARSLAESTSPIAQQALFLGQEALPRTGGTMTGNINMGGRYLLNIGQSGAVNDAATVGQVNTAQSTANTALTTANAALPKAGGTMTGKITLDGAPTSGLHASTKSYVDTANAATAAAAATAQSSADTANNNANGRVARSGDTMSGSLTINAGLYLGGELAKYVDGNLRFHLHNEGLSLYSDLVVTGSIVSEGQMRMSDAGRPEDNSVYQNNDRRWLLYHGDGVVRRMSETTFRWMVLGVSSGSSETQKSHIVNANDAPNVTSLRAKAFQWDADQTKVSAYPGTRYGLIAEEVADVDERLVMRGPDGEVTGLDQHALIAALIAKVTELEQRIDSVQETA